MDGLLQMTMLLYVILTAVSLRVLPYVAAARIPADGHDGVYRQYIDRHNYGYLLRYEREIHIAMYDARLIFHLTLPDWNVRFNDLDRRYITLHYMRKFIVRVHTKRKSTERALHSQ